MEFLLIKFDVVMKNIAFYICMALTAITWGVFLTSCAEEEGIIHGEKLCNKFCLQPEDMYQLVDAEGGELQVKLHGSLCCISYSDVTIEETEEGRLEYYKWIDLSGKNNIMSVTNFRNITGDSEDGVKKHLRYNGKWFVYDELQMVNDEDNHIIITVEPNLSENERKVYLMFTCGNIMCNRNNFIELRQAASI